VPSETGKAILRLFRFRGFEGSLYFLPPKRKTMRYRSERNSRDAMMLASALDRNSGDPLPTSDVRALQHRRCPQFVPKSTGDKQKGLASNRRKSFIL
jgi:hypothetical protein